MVTLFTVAKGVLTAVARSARRSRRRFPALEPMHLLRVGLEERVAGDVAFLVESALVRPRLGVVESLDCNNNAVTVIYHANDTLHCRAAADPLGTYSDTSDQCTASGDTCHLAYFLPD